MKKKIVVIVAILLFIATITIIFIFNNLSSSKSVDKDNQIEHVSVDYGNYVTIASYDQNGDPLLDTSSIEVDDNSKSSLVITLENGVDHSRDYKVMVLQNFVQTDFYVGNQKSIDKTYLFNAKSRAEISLPISVDVYNDTKELIVLIIKEPDDIVTEFDIHKLAYYEEVYAKRFLVDSDIDQPEVTYKEPDFKYQSEVDDTPVFLSDLEDERKVLPSAREGSKAYLHMGNLHGKEEIKYAVIALQDWRQVSINEDLVLYINAPSNKTIGYDIIIPYTVSNKENLQFVAFPYPYDKWSEKYYHQVEYSFRTAIIPK